MRPSRASSIGDLEGFWFKNHWNQYWAWWVSSRNWTTLASMLNGKQGFSWSIKTFGFEEHHLKAECALQKWRPSTTLKALGVKVLRGIASKQRARSIVSWFNTSVSQVQIIIWEMIAVRVRLPCDDANGELMVSWRLAGGLQVKSFHWNVTRGPAWLLA